MAVKALKFRMRLSLLSTTLLFLLPSISAVDLSNQNRNTTDFIRSSCGATLYPELCYTSLSRYANAVQQSPAKLARIAVAVSLSKANGMVIYVSKLPRQPDYVAEPRVTAALNDCFTTFGDAVDQMQHSLKQMRNLNGGESFSFQMSNVQTWMSAALTNEETCTDGFDDVPDGPIKSDVCDRAGNVKKFTSIALALVNSFVAKETNDKGSP
ncbi:hypothetical protein HHK36_006741 [Tetracentron sinense]|uniref:Pectinesterase inhibitor domain-containing protein n=1 Tax=Tetracentron sinense TaxID=13715 RepID=A0A835DL37_TETSI|nr:hypothetical protein HHK36_006741 [Tetracentron sinense]